VLGGFPHRRSGRTSVRQIGDGEPVLRGLGPLVGALRLPAHQDTSWPWAEAKYVSSAMRIISDCRRCWRRASAVLLAAASVP
jgi:hypothetical protein